MSWIVDLIREGVSAIETWVMADQTQRAEIEARAERAVIAMRTTKAETLSAHDARTAATQLLIDEAKK